MPRRDTIVSLLRYTGLALLFNVLWITLGILSRDLAGGFVVASLLTGGVAVLDRQRRTRKATRRAEREEIEQRLRERAEDLRERIRETATTTALARHAYDAASRSLDDGDFQQAETVLDLSEDALWEESVRRAIDELDGDTAEIRDELERMEAAASQHDFETAERHLEGAASAIRDRIDDLSAAAERAAEDGRRAEGDDWGTVIDAYERAIDRLESARQPAAQLDDDGRMTEIDGRIEDIRRRRERAETGSELAAVQATIDEGDRLREEGSLTPATQRYEDAADQLDVIETDADTTFDGIDEAELRDRIDHGLDACRRREIEWKLAEAESTIGTADRLRKDGSIGEARKRYETAGKRLDDLDPDTVADLVGVDVSTLRDRIDDGIEDCRRRRLERELGEIESTIETADRFREDDSIAKARSRYETAMDRLDDLDPDAPSAVDDVDVSGLRERVRSGRKACRHRRMERKLERAEDEIDTGDPSEVRDTFEELLERIDQFEAETDESLSDLRRRAEEGSLRARVRAASERIDVAEDQLPERAFEAKTTFDDVSDTLDSLLEEAVEFGLSEVQSTVSTLIRRSQDGSDAALAAMSDDSTDDSERTRRMPIGGRTEDSGTPSAETPPPHERLELLGSGGNADVYRIRRETDGEITALKVPRWQGTLSTTVVEQFSREAETWARIDDHDNVVTVRASGTQPYPWIELEYLGGGNLAERIGDLDLERAIDVVSSLCDAVQHAHHYGVAHTDLKPANVLFTTEGTPKIGDWGLARVLLEHSTSIEGMTPTYAAPEQLDPDAYGDPDVFTDLYQLGVITYELVTGRPPFDGATPAATTRSILTGSPDPPSDFADVSPALDGAILRALESAKDDRHESVLYFRDELRGALA